LERIVRASLEILEEEGLTGLTVQAIVTRAKSSVGSFYARFSGKEDLLDYLEDRLWREAAIRWDRALAERDWSPLGLRGVAWGAVALLDEAGTARATYLRALGLGAGRHDDAYSSFRVRFGLRAMLTLIEAPPHDPEGEPFTADQVQAEAVGVLLAYLGGEPGDAGSEPSSARVDFFDIWG
jgi:AcrR family transcriptional regulator